MSSALIYDRFHQSYFDYSLFIWNHLGNFITLLVYIDDIILVENNLKDIANTKQSLSSNFKIEDKDKLKYLLVMEVACSNQGITLYQRKYALEILEDTGFLSEKTSRFPIEHNLSFVQTSMKPLINPSPYQWILDQLIYLTITRLDLVYVIYVLTKLLDKSR